MQRQKSIFLQHKNKIITPKKSYSATQQQQQQQHVIVI